jgi:c-di-GMP-binding flagellar brake protein YcgR
MHSVSSHDDQRREYFRMAVRLSMLVPTVQSRSVPAQGVPYLPPLGDGSDFRLLQIEDLSAGGCRARVPVDWPPVGSRLPGYLYLDDERGPLEVELLVVRREDEDTDEPVEAFSFLRLRERNRQRILRRLFREYRRERARAATRDSDVN